MNKDESEAIVPMEQIEGLIHNIRGQKIILDQDLAALYGVSTGAFNRATARNQDRFPADFAFQLTPNEWQNLKCQIGISRLEWGGRHKLPTAFTEHGVAMAANLIKSKRAIKMSVEIVRAFIRLREFLSVQRKSARSWPSSNLLSSSIQTPTTKSFGGFGARSKNPPPRRRKKGNGGSGSIWDFEKNLFVHLKFNCNLLAPKRI